MALIPDQVIDDMAEVSDKALKLYIVYCRVRNGKTGRICPSISTVSQITKIHPKTLYRYRAELINAGWISLENGEIIAQKGFSISSHTATADIDSEGVIGGSSCTATNSKKPRKVAVQLPEVAVQLPEVAVQLPEVAVQLPNSSCTATAINRNNQQIEPAKEPAKRLQTPNPFFEIFKMHATAAADGAPYAHTTADFVRLAALVKRCEANSWELTEERFTRAAQNYFASPLSKHTLADLAERFSVFFKSALDRYGKPAEAGNGAGQGIAPRQFTTRATANNQAAAEEAKRQFAEKLRQKQALG